MLTAILTIIAAIALLGFGVLAGIAYVWWQVVTSLLNLK